MLTVRPLILLLSDKSSHTLTPKQINYLCLTLCRVTGGVEPNPSDHSGHSFKQCNDRRSDEQLT